MIALLALILALGLKKEINIKTMQIYLPDLIDWCLSNIPRIDLTITIVVLVFILYAKDRETYYAKDYKHSLAISWHWRMIGTIIFWSFFVLASILCYFSL